MASQFETLSEQQITRNYEHACEQYNQLGVNVEEILNTLSQVAVSVHCWQGDDVTGFENKDDPVDSGGLQATGNYRGAARNGEELRSDMEKAFSLIPGKLRCNLHSIYAEPPPGRTPDRNELAPEDFNTWIDWAKANDLQMDFNPTYFAHPKADQGYTLASTDTSIRNFWIEHGIACRRIAEHMGRETNGPCTVNHWMPDGSKDHPVDRWTPRKRLKDSLNQILDADVQTNYCRDTVECKLFGIGSEDYVVGSHEFYVSYVSQRPDVMLCLDMGHFHPTENIADKLSAMLTVQDELLLHISRGIRWDSDHVVIFNDEVKGVMHELVRGDSLHKARLAVDFFDASINRVGAWTLGVRSLKKALLFALLEPSKQLLEMSQNGDGAGKLALLEELKHMPYGAVWDMFCLRNDVPVGPAWINEIHKYEEEVLSKR